LNFAKVPAEVFALIVVHATAEACFDATLRRPNQREDDNWTSAAWQRFHVKQLQLWAADEDTERYFADEMSNLVDETSLCDHAEHIGFLFALLAFARTLFQARRIATSQAILDSPSVPFSLAPSGADEAGPAPSSDGDTGPGGDWRAMRRRAQELLQRSAEKMRAVQAENRYEIFKTPNRSVDWDAAVRCEQSAASLRSCSGTPPLACVRFSSLCPSHPETVTESVVGAARSAAV
jgi:hypothetical protein